MWSLIYNVFAAMLILLATITMVLETVDSLYHGHQQLWYIIDSVVTYLFTFELMLRIVSRMTGVKPFMKFLLSPLFIVDLVSIVPFYIEVVEFHTETFTGGRLSGLRLLRVFRLFKAFRFINQVRYISISFEIAGESVRKSLGPLFPLFFTMTVSIVILGTFMYYCERGTYDVVSGNWYMPDGSVSHFESIPQAMWFVATTLTTTGYGDVAPMTPPGRIVAFVAMLFGLLLIALPSIIIGRNFSILWANLKTRNAIPDMPEWLNRLTGRASSY